MSLLMRCRAVMLDLDGTLVDTLPDFVAAIDFMLSDLQLPPLAAPTVAGMIGKGGEFLVRSVLAHSCGREPAADEIAAALARFWPLYRAVNGRHSRVFPGVAEGLQRLHKRGFKLACVTNKPTAESQALLHAHGLDHFFQEVTGGDRFSRLKPDPLPLLQTCAAMDCPPAQSLMVGDSVNDARAAHAAGCPIVLVTYGYNHGEPVRQVDADGYVDSLADLALI